MSMRDEQGLNIVLGGWIYHQHRTNEHEKNELRWNTMKAGHASMNLLKMALAAMESDDQAEKDRIMTALRKYRDADDKNWPLQQAFAREQGLIK